MFTSEQSVQKHKLIIKGPRSLALNEQGSRVACWYFKQLITYN